MAGTILLAFFLLIFISLILILEPEFSFATRILKLINKKLKSRERIDETALIENFSVKVDVPREFACRYLSCLAASYNVKMGHLRLDDRFDRDLSMHISELPSSLKRR